CRARAREGVDCEIRRSPRPEGRSDRLGRAHPVLRNAQLRPTRARKSPGLPRSFRRRLEALDRSRPASWGNGGSGALNAARVSLGGTATVAPRAGTPYARPLSGSLG